MDAGVGASGCARARCERGCEACLAHRSEFCKPFSMSSFMLRRKLLICMCSIFMKKSGLCARLQVGTQLLLVVVAGSMPRRLRASIERMLGFECNSCKRLRKKVQILPSSEVVKYSVRLSGPATCNRARGDAWLSQRMPPSRRAESRAVARAEHALRRDPRRPRSRTAHAVPRNFFFPS